MLQHHPSAEKTISSLTSIRINRYICASGICSRKAADRYVEQGVVLINGKRARLGDKVLSCDTVTLDGQLVETLPPDKVIFILMNKPVGVVCTAAEADERNIIAFINHRSRVFPVGRLDKDSQGLIFLTNRSDLVHRILRADNLHEKEYRVTVNKEVNEEFITGMCKGVPMLGVLTRKCMVVKESRYVFRITLVQGLNRQIRRMCKHFGFSVQKLERIRIMHLTLDGLTVGQWRELTPEELSGLFGTLETTASNRFY